MELPSKNPEVSLARARIDCVALLVLFLMGISRAGFPASRGDARTAHRAGLYISAHGEPAPSMMGLNLGINVASFLRVTGGVGGYNNAIANTPRAVGNYTIVPIGWALYSLVKPIGFGFAWLMDGLAQFLSTGHVRTHLEYRPPSYADMRFPYLSPRAIFTYGGGARLFVPGWKLSPTLGGNWAHFTTRASPYGLPDTKSHFYYSGGLDWQGESGLNFSAGMNLCPSLPKGSGVCGFYANFGSFF